MLRQCASACSAGKWVLGTWGPVQQHPLKIKRGFAVSKCYYQKNQRFAGGILALYVHWALLLDRVPPEEPPGTPIENVLRIRRSKLPQLKKEEDITKDASYGSDGHAVHVMCKV